MKIFHRNKSFWEGMYILNHIHFWQSYSKKSLTKTVVVQKNERQKDPLRQIKP